MITVEQLSSTLKQLSPVIGLERNAVGNIMLVDPTTHAYLGYIDLRTGEIDLLEDDEEDEW